jgi:hypothetical protein
LGTTLKSDLRSYAPSVIDMTDLPDEGEGYNNGEEPSTKKRRITTCEPDAPASKTKGGKKDAAGDRKEESYLRQKRKSSYLRMTRMVKQKRIMLKRS